MAFFVSTNGVKVHDPVPVPISGIKGNASGPVVLEVFVKDLFPAIRKTYSQEDWIFIQDEDSNLVQNFLRENFHRRQVKKQSWPPKSLNSNPLDFYFWSHVKRKVYEGRHNRPSRVSGSSSSVSNQSEMKLPGTRVKLEKPCSSSSPLKAVEERQGPLSRHCWDSRLCA